MAMRSVLGGMAGMTARRRRRLDAVLLAVAALLVGVAAAVGAAVGDTERITGMWAGAVISSDGSARVTEVIDYDFGVQSRHGIFRDVPGLRRDAAVRVSSPTAPDQFQLISMGDVTRIRIGDPSRTIRGRHRYWIEYPLDDLAPGGRLAWDAVGIEWPVKVGGIEIHVVAPFEFTGIRCAQGAAGSQQACGVVQVAPGHLVGRIDTLGKRQGATLYATAGRQLGDAPRLPVPPSGEVADPGASPLLPGLLGAAVALLAAAAAARLVRRLGRDRVAAGGHIGAALGATGSEQRVDPEKLGSLVTVGSIPPAELTPTQGGILLTESVRYEHKVAWLISAAIDGHLEIEGDGRAPTLKRRPGAGAAPLDRFTEELLDQAFDGRNELTLGTYDPSFAAAWRALGDRLKAWQRTCGLWDPAGDRRRTRARVIGAILVALGLSGVVVGGVTASSAGGAWQAIVAAGAVIAGIGLAMVICGWELRVRTPTGSGLWLQMESFRRFLAGSGAPQADEAATGGQLGQYTAWAVALGEIDRWSRAVASSTRAPSRSTYVPMHDPMFARSLSSAASASSTSPSSSSGGGGGGSGGGGGGGGGGSW
jgi:Predicted membrane protein (DUF2207)